MKFREYKNFDLSAISEEVLSWWEANQIFEKSVSEKPADKPYVFYEGPPSANGMPGIHHVMARTIKDIFCRYKTQCGYQVRRKAGWDTHGLPVELGVEKELGIDKEDIGVKISIEDYNKACREAVMRYTNVWNSLTKKMGYWVDMDDPYITYKSKYMESVWWLLKQIYDKGLLYKGYTIQPYSPKAGTGLSSHELNQPGCYKPITDTSVTAQFKAVQSTLPAFLSPYKNLHFLAWTTTPWTLPSNTALAVGRDIKYVVVKTYNQYTFSPIEVILAEDLVSTQFSAKYAKATGPDLPAYNATDKKIPYQVVADCLGKDLENIRYHQLLPYVLPHENPENAFRVIIADFVTTEDGTGIVHIAPTFGADDAFAAKNAMPPVPPMLVLDEHGNPVPLVDLKGKFRKEVGALGGKYVKNEYYDDGEAPEKSVDVEIAILLKEQNKAFLVEKYQHNYPHCWRTDKPILYYPMDSWFIKISAVRERLFDLNTTIRWKPVSTGEGRFGNWLKNANDWNLSRSRFWGVPLPIWRTADGKEELVVGSVEQLKAEIGKSVQAGFMPADHPFVPFKVGDMSDANYDQIDLHKNQMDKVVLASPSGQPMKREADLVDVWFDSGAMPYAQWHYPFEYPTLETDSTRFPADFIAEGVDQTRGWFYTLHAIAGIVSDSIAYKTVISNGLVLDKNGQKMSKRLGNSIDPFEVLETHSPDATRWYMASNANPWDNLRFDIEGVIEVKRKFFGTLFNTYSFFSLYANIDGFNASEKPVPMERRPELDRWILSELHTLTKTAGEAFADYEATKAARAISDFVQERLSNWYVRLCRRRFWKGDYNEDKIAAYQTLHTCLTTVSRLMAPIAPFYADALYRDLTLPLAEKSPESVHLSDFPTYDAGLIDKTLERRMAAARSISSLVLSLRKKEGIKVRQPLSKVMVPILIDTEKEDIEAVAELIKSEVNVKEIEFLDKHSNVIVKQIKPNFKVLGPKYGADLKAVVDAIQACDQDSISEIEQKGSIPLNINDKSVLLQRSEVEISSQDIEGCLVASDGFFTVALDVVITEGLRQEGIARELVNRIQNIRKEKGLEVIDKIDLTFSLHPDIEEVVRTNGDYIKNETLARHIAFSETFQGVEVAFDDLIINVLITKI